MQVKIAMLQGIYFLRTFCLASEKRFLLQSTSYYAPRDVGHNYVSRFTNRAENFPQDPPFTKSDYWTLRFPQVKNGNKVQIFKLLFSIRHIHACSSITRDITVLTLGLIAYIFNFPVVIMSVMLSSEFRFYKCENIYLAFRLVRSHDEPRFSD